MPSEISLTKTEYINLIETLRKELNVSLAPKTVSTETLQDITSRSLGFSNHLSVLAFFNRNETEKESHNFTFKKNFYHFLSIQCKTDDSWADRALVLAETILCIADYKKYKLSSRSIERLLPLSNIMEVYKDKKTPVIIKEQIIKYLQTLSSFENPRKITKILVQQHDYNIPYILIACKMKTQVVKN